MIEELMSQQVILPSQFYEGRRSDPDAPLKRLMLAVLIDALDCLSRNRRGAANQAAAREAAHWIAEADEGQVFSFSGVCETLGIHADALRSALPAWLASGRGLMRRSPVTFPSSCLSAPRVRRTRKRAQAQTQSCDG